MSNHALRAKRPPHPRARTLSVRRLKATAPRRVEADERQLVFRLFLDEPEEPRPQTWADCQGATGPCAYVGCRYHRYLDVNERGGIKINFPDLEPWELEDPCALRIAERGPSTLQEVGGLLNLTRERVRQLQDQLLTRLADDLEDCQ